MLRCVSFVIVTLVVFGFVLVLMCARVVEFVFVVVFACVLVFVIALVCMFV